MRRADSFKAEESNTSINGIATKQWEAKEGWIAEVSRENDEVVVE